MTSSKCSEGLVFLTDLNADVMSIDLFQHCFSEQASIHTFLHSLSSSLLTLSPKTRILLFPERSDAV